jgi:hypothetical protein
MIIVGGSVCSRLFTVDILNWQRRRHHGIHIRRQTAAVPDLGRKTGAETDTRADIRSEGRFVKLTVLSSGV